MHAAVFKCVQRIKKVLVLGTSEHVKIKVKFNKIIIAGEPYPNLGLSVPDRRRIGHVNVICMYSNTALAGRRAMGRGVS